MSLRLTLIANYAGSTWTALVGMIFIPMYIQYMGLEAYGLVGFSAVLFAWFSLLDLGMMQTLGRELARSNGSGGNALAAAQLVRSIERVTLLIGALVVILLCAASSWIAASLAEKSALPVGEVRLATALIGVLAAIRLMESLFRSCLVALSRQVIQNAIGVTVATVRAVGAIIVLRYVESGIGAFFIWQVCVTAVGVLVSGAATYRSLAVRRSAVRFSWSSVESLKGFAISMVIINVLKLMLTQSDKLLLAHYLSLADYGAYTIALSVAALLSALVIPVVQAWTPRMNGAHASGNEEGLIVSYHQSAQLVTILLGSAALAVIVWSESILALWTHDSVLAKRTAPTLSVLMIGSLLNGLWWIPYQAQLVHGWTSLAVRLQIVALAFVLPSLLIVVPSHGAIGAAWVWVALNALYLVAGSWVMFSRILVRERFAWVWYDTIRPLLAIATIVIGLRHLMPREQPLSVMAFLVTAVIISLTAGLLAAPLLRGYAVRWLLTRFEGGHG